LDFLIGFLIDFDFIGNITQCFNLILLLIDF